MVQLESRKAELEQVLVDAEEPPPLLHPEMATFYRDQVSNLHEALQADTEATRLKAGEVLRSLVKEIILAHEGRRVEDRRPGRSRRHLGDFPQNENPGHWDRGFAS